MGGMTVEATTLAGLYEIGHPLIGDARGRFTRLFCDRELACIRPDLRFAQINWSETRQRGTLRGMHYQRPPAAEAKLIHCLHGRVYDVAVDLRAGSPTFLHWHAVELAADAGNALFIPEGFAHGFQALTDEAHLLYMHTTPWTPDCEAGLHHADPRLAITWPLPPAGLSARDAGLPQVDAAFRGVQA